MASTKCYQDELRLLLENYRKICAPTNVFRFLDFLSPGKTYIPGINFLMFMSRAHSLLENSAYKDELEWMRGQLNNYAQSLSNLEENARYGFNNESFMESVHNIFKIKGERQKIIHDHSFNYRERKQEISFYQNFTIQELVGFIDLLFHKHGGVNRVPEIKPMHKISGIDRVFPPLTDNSHYVCSCVKRSVPLAFFPSCSIMFNIKKVLFKIINIRLGGEFNFNSLKKYTLRYPPVYLFIPTNNFRFFNFNNELNKIKSEFVFSKLFEMGAIRIIESKQFTNVFHLFQLGENALAQLQEIKENQGAAIFDGKENLFMSDSLDMDRIYVHGPNEEYYTLLQKGIDLIGSFPFLSCSETKLFPSVKDQSNCNCLDTLEEKYFGVPNQLFFQKRVKSIYHDGLPWSGFLIKTCSRYNLKIEIFEDGAPIAPAYFTTKNWGKKNHFIACNGGYFVNRKLINQEKLPQTVLWKPLGLVYCDGVVRGLPLFNKAALIISRTRQIQFDRVSIKNGFQITYKNGILDFKKCNYNKYSESECSFFDLMYEDEHINNGKTIILKLAGNFVFEASLPEKGKTTSTSTIGLTLSIPPESYSDDLIKNPYLNFSLKNTSAINWNYTSFVLEGGPLLLKDGDICIDLANEGWHLEKSVRTQIARTDMLNLRGPKMAIGKDKEGNIYLGGINGRVRNSVGGTFHEIANFLVSEGVDDAIMLDSGGSSSLISGEVFLNVPAYCKKNKDEITYFGLSMPRKVANSIIIEVPK